MPIKSKAQMRYLFSQAPKTAEDMADESSSMKNLPDRVGGKDPAKNKPVTSSFKRRRKSGLSSYQ
jgi:hypothetical protein